jgi:hypothetical protein
LLVFLQFVLRIELGSVWKTYRSWLWMAPLARAISPGACRLSLA